MSCASFDPMAPQPYRLAPRAPLTRWGPASLLSSTVPEPASSASTPAKAPPAPEAALPKTYDPAGSLHMGHAFNTALIDTIVRFQRLQGKNVLCLPGTDHASIAVQTILEKQLKAEGASKDDLGRDAFFERAWAWKAQSGGGGLAAPA